MLSGANKPLMPSVAMLNVVILSVVAPTAGEQLLQGSRIWNIADKMEQ